MARSSPGGGLGAGLRSKWRGRLEDVASEGFLGGSSLSMDCTTIPSLHFDVVFERFEVAWAVLLPIIRLYAQKGKFREIDVVR